ncbi:unnamed protein product, partial [Ectocarpus sp. 12 AP-2014]
MAASRRRSGCKYVEAATVRRHPETQYPPDGYCLIEADLHRATTSLEVASFPFLAQLKLRSAINLSAEPLHDKVNGFFLAEGVNMLHPQSLESFDGPYDLWEEAAKESLELLLDAGNHPMILIDSPTECESACLVGCLRRLQHWSMVAIHDEYHMMTMRNTRYSTSQRFIERFDLDIVTLKAKANLPPWYRNHLDMLEEERTAEVELARRDPDRPARAWTHGVLPTPLPPEQREGENEGLERNTSNRLPADPRQPIPQANQSEKIVSHERGRPLSDQSTVDGGQGSCQAVGGSHTEVVEEADAARSGQSAQGGDDEDTTEGRASERRTAGAG